MTEHDDLEALQRATMMLSQYYDFRGQYHEAQSMATVVIARIRRATPSRQRDTTLAVILTYQGWIDVRVGRLRQAQEAFEESLALHDDLDIQVQPGQATDPLIGMGVLALVRGNYAEAARQGEAARQRAEAQRHAHNLPMAWYVLTSAAQAQGQLQAAQQCAQHAYASAQQARDHWFMAYCLNELGNCARALGAYDQARQHYAASYTLREEFHDSEGMALALALLGKVALLQGEHAEARDQYERSLAIYRTIFGDRGGLATALAGLGLAECRLGNYAPARRCLSEALAIASDMEYTSLLGAIAASAAELLAHTSQVEPAVELLAAIQRQPASDRDTQEQARRLLTHCKGALEPAAFAAATRRGQVHDMDTIVAQLAPELARANDHKLHDTLFILAL
jgi:tetratricopeptide (TPR) repeat protein